MWPVQGDAVGTDDDLQPAGLENCDQLEDRGPDEWLPAGEEDPAD
jgi:hypothetical protein